MTGWKRNDTLKAPATLAQKMPIPDDERRAQLLSQAKFLEAHGQHDAAEILRRDAEAMG